MFRYFVIKGAPCDHLLTMALASNQNGHIQNNLETTFFT